MPTQLTAWFGRHLGQVAALGLVGSLLASCASQPREIVAGDLGRIVVAPPQKGSYREGASAAWLKSVVISLFNGYAQHDVPLRHALPKAKVHTGLHKLMQSRTAALWIGHSTFLLRVGGLTVLTDPIFSKTASPVPFFGPRRYLPPALVISELPSIDAILVTHNHFDHLDEASLSALNQRFPDAALFLPKGTESRGRDAGFRRIRALEAGEIVTFKGVDLVALPAYHQMGPADTTRALNFSLRAAHGASMFFAGDTGYGPIFRRIRAVYGPHDVALVPIGDYEPIDEVGSLHARPEDALKIADDLGARVAIGMHWGTFPLSEVALYEPAQRFMRAKGSVRPAVLRIGECLVLDDIRSQ
jgi:N-acyl-phosphatidylethanolamine-hydrolysing phospholipase D